MKLQSLKLTNFQGVKALELVFDGKNASIYGDNGTGKTTIYNAFSWILTGKSGTGEKGYTPKTNDSTGGEVHNLDHSAEMVLDIDGQIVSLKKTFREVWKKKRGSTTKELTGNTTDSFINGVITKEKDYAEFVKMNIAPEERLRLLTQVDYFLEVMPWAKRRQVLVDLCGEMSDMDIIQQNEQLSDLPAFLTIPHADGQLYTVDEYRKIADARKRDINRQLDILPGRIDEAAKSIPEIPAGVTEDDVRAQVKVLQDDLKEVQGRRQMMSADYATHRIDSELATLRAEREAAKAAHTAKEAERLRGGVDKTLELDQRASEYRQTISKLQLEIADTTREKQNAETRRTELLERWNDYYVQVWDSENEICPTCGQRLPADQIEGLKASFNERKSKAMTQISAEGKAVSVDVIKGLQDKIGKLQARLNAENAALAEVTAQQNELRGSQQMAPFDSNEFDEKEKDLLERKQNAVAEAETRTSDLDKKIADLEQQIQDKNRLLLDLDLATRQKQRVAELEAEEKRLGGEYETLEQGLYLCDEFVRAKVSMIDQRINGMFSTIRFKLFEEQMNGGLKECCEALIPSDAGALVPYPSANDAAKVNAGLECIQALAGYYGAELPVILDNAERVTHPLPIRQQVIRLAVSEADKALRLEVAP